MSKGMFSDQVVFVSGGAGGIGRCIASRFLAQGAQVHIADISNERTMEFLREFPAASATVADLANPDATANAIDELQAHYGRLDIVINNAGDSGPTAEVQSVSVEDWNRTIAIDLNAHFYVTRLAVPLLLKQGGGSIINIASSAAHFGYPFRSPYTAAKWALIGLTKTWAMELGPRNIRVNAVCPGAVEGERMSYVINRDAKLRNVDPNTIRNMFVAQTSLERFVTADDVTNMVSYLCSPMGAMISGQSIGVDGHTEGLTNKG